MFYSRAFFVDNFDFSIFSVNFGQGDGTLPTYFIPTKYDKWEKVVLLQAFKNFLLKPLSVILSIAGAYCLFTLDWLRFLIVFTAWFLVGYTGQKIDSDYTLSELIDRKSKRK